MFICVEWWPAGGYLYRQEGSDLSLAHTSSQPYISPWIKFPTEYSIQTFNSNFRSNPNISSVLPGLGMKGFIQSSWACTSLSLCHAVMPRCYNIHYYPTPSQHEGIPYIEWECAKREAHLKRCRRSSYRYIAYTLGTDYFLTLTLLFQLIGPLCSNDIPRN